MKLKVLAESLDAKSFSPHGVLFHISGWTRIHGNSLASPLPNPVRFK